MAADLLDEYGQTDLDYQMWQKRAEACGTSFCMAGWAVQLTEGVEFGERSQIGFPGGKYRGLTWTEAGRDALGLTHTEAADLFDALNSRMGIQGIAQQIAARAGEEL